MKTKLTNMDKKSVNRERVAKWSEKKFREGYKSLTVCLHPDIYKMVEYLRGIYFTKKTTTKLISAAVEQLYKVVKTKRRN